MLATHVSAWESGAGYTGGAKKYIQVHTLVNVAQAVPCFPENKT